VFLGGGGRGLDSSSRACCLRVVEVLVAGWVEVGQHRTTDPSNVSTNESAVGSQS
jgi:hypothetical protein